MGDILPPHGHYHKLASYQKSVIVFHATTVFCARFLRRGDRTIDQMTQAARSGKQNIIEGCAASGTSKEMELKLVGVARASLEELLEDYRDHLRTHNLALWDKNDERTLNIRKLAKLKNESYEHYKPTIEQGDAETVCNTLICLTNQATYLLNRQIASLEKAFVEQGGLKERMYKARIEHRNKNQSPHMSHMSPMSHSPNEAALARLRALYKEVRELPLADDALKQHLLNEIEQVGNLLK